MHRLRVERPNGMWRTFVMGVVLAGVLAGCSWSGQALQSRISRHVLERQIAKSQGAKTVCSRHTKDGSHWGCLVGDGMDPECYVIDVSERGKWSIEDAPRSCHYP